MIQFQHNFNEFSEFVRTFSQMSGLQNADVVRKIAAVLLRKIILRSPVKTGRSRAGWIAAGEVLKVRVPASEDSLPGDSDVSVEITDNDATIRMINNVFYVPWLEMGLSKQAPLGMVRISLLEMQSGGDMPPALADNYVKLWEVLSRQQRFWTQNWLFANNPVAGGMAAEALEAVRDAREQ